MNNLPTDILTKANQAKLIKAYRASIQSANPNAKAERTMQRHIANLFDCSGLREMDEIAGIKPSI